MLKYLRETNELDLSGLVGSDATAFVLLHGDLLPSSANGSLAEAIGIMEISLPTAEVVGFINNTDRQVKDIN